MPVEISMTFADTFSKIDLNCTKHNRFSNVSLYRLLFPFIDQLFDYDKILYLDADTVIVGDVNVMFDFDLTHPYAMFSNIIHDKGRYQKCVVDVIDYLKTAGFENLNMPKLYSNSGVLLYDMQLMNKQREQMKTKLTKLNDVFDVDKFTYPDQDILNVLFEHDEIADEKLIYNSNVYSTESIVFHYCGPDKER